MVDQLLLNNLTKNANSFAARWKAMVRKAHQLKHYNTMDDQTLIEKNAPLYPVIAKLLDRGLDTTRLGTFCVKHAKAQLHEGYPLSEIIYSLNLSEKVLIDYITSEYAPENHVKMYMSIGAMARISEVFLLASFYITKGYLEEVYTNLLAGEGASEELLKKYLNDDFFFKQT